MVTPRKPDETDEDYVRRLAAVDGRWKQAFAEADRSIADLTMLVALGGSGGFDDDGLDGWQRRAAFLWGASVGGSVASEAIGLAASAAQLHTHDFLAAIPPDLGAAFDAMSILESMLPDTATWITQAEIYAVTAAAATIAQLLRPTIDSLKSNN